MNVADSSKLAEILSSPEFRQLEKAVIMGKGPTFQQVDSSPGVLRLCVNHAIMMLDDVDFLIAIDAETIEGISDQDLQKAKFIILPVFPQINHCVQTEINFSEILRGRTLTKDQWVIPINPTFFPPHPGFDPKYLDLTSEPSSISSGNTGLEFIVVGLPWIRSIETYGISNSLWKPFIAKLIMVLSGGKRISYLNRSKEFKGREFGHHIVAGWNPKGLLRIAFWFRFRAFRSGKKLKMN